MHECNAQFDSIAAGSIEIDHFGGKFRAAMNQTLLTGNNMLLSRLYKLPYDNDSEVTRRKENHGGIND